MSILTAALAIFTVICSHIVAYNLGAYLAAVKMLKLMMEDWPTETPQKP